MHLKRELGILTVMALLGASSGTARIAEAQTRGGTSSGPTGPAVSRPNTTSTTTSKACVDSFERGQAERMARNYSAAHDDLIACSQESCPARIVAECIQLIELLRNEIPNVGFRVTDGNGQELFDVEVTLDDRVVTSKLDGATFELNPGVHKLQISASGYEPFSTTFSVHPGERGRIISAELKSLKKDAPVTAPSKPVVILENAPVARADSSFRIPAATYVAGGVAVAALGSFVYFRATAASDYNNLIAQCSPRCTPNQVDPVHAKFVASLVSLGVAGAAAAVGGVTLILSQPGKKSQEATTSLHWLGSSAYLQTKF